MSAHARALCPAFVRHLIAVSVFVRARPLSSLLPCPPRLGSSLPCLRRSIWGERTFRGGRRRPKIAFIGGTGRVGGSHTHAHTHAQSQTRTSSRAHTSTHTRIALSSLENAHQCAFARAHKGTWTMRELVRLTKGDVDLVIAGRKKVSLCVIGAEGACPVLEPSRVRDPTAGAYVVDRGADVAWPQCGMAPTAIRKRCVNRLDRG